MTKAPFERALLRKGRGALKVARLALNAGDNDSAVSRSYYAMFDFAQAALLRAGDKPSLAKEYESPTAKDDDKVSEPTVAGTDFDRTSAKPEPISLEEIRRQARENWLQLRSQIVSEAKRGAAHSKVADRGAEKDQGLSTDDSLDE